MTPPRTTTPTLDLFLRDIRGAIEQRNGARLQYLLQVEPPLHDAYEQVVSEMRAIYPQNNDGELAARCDQLVPLNDNGLGSSWGAFPGCVLQYLRILRDMNWKDLPNLYLLLSSLAK